MIGKIKKFLSFVGEKTQHSFDNLKLSKIVITCKTYTIIESKTFKMAMGPDYNYFFNKITGKFMRWGKTFQDDPEFSPIGGEILDIEVTTICPMKCPFCYKSNTENGINMPFELFKNIIDSMPKTLTQVAFGADAFGTSNPDLFKMAKYCREIGVVPNITLSNISDDIADKLVKYMGAVAVSRYANKNICYDSIKKLTDRGMEQVNMHFMIHADNFSDCMETLRDIKTDKRLEGLNAIVFLSLKQKGRGVEFKPLSQEKYREIVQYCLDNQINFGMDSCSAVKFLNCIKDDKNYENFKVLVEPCESTNFSQYVDAHGDFYPCSFCEEIEGWEKGISLKGKVDYLKDVWYNHKVKKFRDKLNNNCNNCHKARECPIYNI